MTDQVHASKIGPDTQVVILDGPYAGFEGLVLSVDYQNGFAIVDPELFGSIDSVGQTFRLDQLKLVSSPPESPQVHQTTPIG